MNQLIYFLFISGTYLLSINDREITVTELKAIARPAKAGSNVIPKVGYKTPASIGIKIVL